MAGCAPHCSVAPPSEISVTMTSCSVLNDGRITLPAIAIGTRLCSRFSEGDAFLANLPMRPAPTGCGFRNTIQNRDKYRIRCANIALRELVAGRLRGTNGDYHVARAERGDRRAVLRCVVGHFDRDPRCELHRFLVGTGNGGAGMGQLFRERAY